MKRENIFKLMVGCSVIIFCSSCMAQDVKEEDKVSDISKYEAMESPQAVTKPQRAAEEIITPDKSALSEEQLFEDKPLPETPPPVGESAPKPTDTTEQAYQGTDQVTTTFDDQLVRSENAAAKFPYSDSSHWNLTVTAWENLAAKNYEGVFFFANECLKLYEADAKEMAKKMKSFVGFGHEDDYSLVNDVATAHYIMGEAYMKLEKYTEALKEFNLIMQEYPFAQCWDPKGWFWKVAEVSKKNIDKINNLMAGPKTEAAQ